MIIGEPNFSNVHLPWHNLRFWYVLDALRRGQSVGSDVIVLPVSAELWALPVEFRDLWKIRSPLHEVEGFNMAEFDHIVMVQNITFQVKTLPC